MGVVVRRYRLPHISYPTLLVPALCNSVLTFRSAGSMLPARVGSILPARAGKVSALLD